MRRTSLACLALSGALIACSAPEVRNTYEGPDRSRAEVAILFTPREGVYDAEARRAHFSAANGKAVGTFMSGFPDATRIAPGTYLLKVRCFDPKLWNPRLPSPLAEKFMLFQATVEPGHFYELGCDAMKAYAIDRGTAFESVKNLLHPDAVEKLRR